MEMRSHLICSAAIAVAVLGCNKTDANAMGDAAAKPGTSSSASTSSASSGTFGPDSVSVDWTGKFVDSDGEKQVPVFKVTNKSAKDVFYLKVWYYYYDGAKKQIGRAFYERYSLDIKPGQSQEMPLGGSKDKIKGDVKTVQAVVVGATYTDHGKWDGDVKTLAPEQRPMK